MKEQDKKKRKKLIIEAIVFAIIVAIIAVVIVLLTYKKETRTVESTEHGETSALICTSHDNTHDDENDKTFFYSDTAINVKHTVKYVYVNDKVDKLSYEYEGDYSSEEEAEKDSGHLHTRYNLYLGERGVDHEMLTPVFQNSGRKALIRLYLDDYRKMNAVIGRVFYIGNGMVDTIGKNSAKETKKIYENKGFSCIINN